MVLSEIVSAVREGDLGTDRLDSILHAWLQATAIDSPLVPPIQTLDELDDFISMTARAAQNETSVEEFRERLADQRD